MAREWADFLCLARAVDSVGRELRLGALERLIVNDAKRLVTVDDVSIFIGPARHPPSRAAIELEAASQVAHFADEHGVGQDAAHGPESPRSAESCGHAARPHATRHFLEADGLGEVRLEDETHRLGFLFVDGQPLLAILALNDAVAVGRRTARPASLAVALHESGPRALGEHAAVVGGDDELHATGQRVRPFGHAHHFDAVLFEILDEHVRLGGAAEPVVLVDVELSDASRLGFLHQPQQFGTPALRATGLRLVDEVAQFLPGGALARLYLNRHAR